MKNKFVTVITSTIELFAGAMGGYLLNEIISNPGFSTFDKWAYGALVFIGLLVICASNILFSSKISNWRFFRKHFAISEFIEGRWIQIIDDSRLQTVPSTKYSIIDLKLENGRITVRGNSYNQNNGGGEMTSFDVLHTTFFQERKILEYLYEFTTREYEGNSKWIGAAQLNFEKTTGSKYYNKYNGTITSNLPRAIGENAICVRAFKHSEEIEIDGEKIRINEETIKRKEVRNYIDERINKIF